MNAEHRELLCRLQRYDFDGNGRAGGFVRRLARENGWTRHDAERACEEYKRFVFLAITAEHPCTPSDEIDQVWHLHLVHTRAYWDHFCGEVLRQPLHHEPARGEAHEAAKFNGWYLETLQSYRAVFGEPPADLWPAAAARFAGRHIRLDAKAFWMARKPSWWQPVASLWSRRMMRWLGLAAITLPIAGCALLSSSPPFSFRGADFLLFFCAVWGVCVWMSEVLRARLDRKEVIPARDPDPYEEAFLCGGPALTANAAIAALVQRGSLHLNGAQVRLQTESPLPQPQSWLERVAVERLSYGSDASLAELRAELQRCAAAVLVPRLEQRGLLLPRDKLRHWLLLALAAPMFGVIKLGIGVMHDRPVVLLTLACVASVLFALLRYGRQRQPTAAGRASVEQLRARTRALEPSQAVGPVEMAIGVFGVQILADTALADASRKSSDASGGSGCAGMGADGGGGGGCGGCGGGCGG